VGPQPRVPENIVCDLKNLHEELRRRPAFQSVGIPAGHGTRWRGGIQLPNPNAILGGEVELISPLDVEGGVPRIEISDRGRAVLSGRMAVFDQELTQGLGTLVNAPALRIGRKNCWSPVRPSTVGASLPWREAI
jgi:hypothetical protein